MADFDPEAVERLSAKLHAIYQDEATRQADMGNDAVRHSDDYAALPEHTKECDRVLARYILQRETDLLGLLRECAALLYDWHRTMPLYERVEAALVRGSLT
jgi:spore cortex formation protein SpoVR/YcgB (stage V sporulation)